MSEQERLAELRAANTELQVLMALEKETDNTIRFEELERPGGLLTLRKLYVQKKALARIDNPSMIEVIIKAAKA